MKKTIVIEPERTETYTEMVPCTKTWTIPAVTKEVEVGPGYIPVWRSGADWLRNGGGPGVRDTYGTYYPMFDYVRELERYYPPDGGRAVLYVPAGVSVDDALAALNALKPVEG